MTDLVVCRWCEGQWNANDPDGFTRHEATCARQIECPRCGAQPRAMCWYPSGQLLIGGHHSQREKSARIDGVGCDAG